MRSHTLTLTDIRRYRHTLASLTQLLMCSEHWCMKQRPLSLFLSLCFALYCSYCVSFSFLFSPLIFCFSNMICQNRSFLFFSVTWQETFLLSFILWFLLSPSFFFFFILYFYIHSSICLSSFLPSFSPPPPPVKVRWACRREHVCIIDTMISSLRTVLSLSLSLAVKPLSFSSQFSTHFPFLWFSNIRQHN